MIEHYDIGWSRSQSIFLISIYSLVILAALIYSASILLLLIMLGLVFLMAITEFNRWSKQGPIKLSLNTTRALIEIEEAGQPQIYDKYKLYTTRWFAILQLADKQKNRSLFLNSDRFTSKQDFQSFRFSIQRLVREKQRGSNAT